MKPIEFEEYNTTLECPGSMNDCQPLPVFRDKKQCISCWRPTWKERLSILLYGKVWLAVLGSNTQPPVWLMGDKTAFEVVK